MAWDGKTPQPKALSAAIAAAGRRAGIWPAPQTQALVLRLRPQLAAWIALELAPGRLLPWLPVAFGFGIVLYFTAAREPLWSAAAGLALAGVIAAVAVRRHAVGFPLALGAATIAAGFAVATLHTARIAHPVLQHTVASAALTGFIEVREERARSDRVVIRLHSFDAPRVAEKPDRVRVAVRKGTAPSVGSFVTLKARLSPPLAPLRPGGYDFARDMYFQRIGASGYALGKIAVTPAPVAQGWALRYAATIDAMREGIDKRIRTYLGGDRGAIASALITGKRDAITPAVNDAMYVSSLAHVLSISGYHMAVVAGIVFFVVRAGLALSPALALRRPIKKWAACLALLAAAFYLLLSGAEVATQRSFIMVAIVLAGVMTDRAAITFRTLSVAAVCVMALAPAAVVHPSFQMSFAATLALIAIYQHGLSIRADADSSLGARIALWGGREIAALLLASLVAGLATTPYAAFHFHRIAPYGVIANLLAMPVVSLLVMPMGILGGVTMPFGFDGMFWQLMGVGIDWMIAVALWVSNLPGAVGRMQAFGTGPLLLVTAGLLLLCLLRSPLRWTGCALALAASVWAVATPQPDVLLTADGQAAAVRGADGRLRILASGRDGFAVKEWLAADGDARTDADDTLKAGVGCDAAGCVAATRDGRPVAYALTAEALAEDCQRARVVLTARTVSARCEALLIDRRQSQAFGALTLRWTSDGVARAAARPAGTDRPWARASAIIATPNVATAPNGADATPSPGDREADD